jgi:hypothetical protein
VKLAEAAGPRPVWLNINDIDSEGAWSGTPAIPKFALRSLGKCMDDPSGRASSGTNVVLWECHGGNNQKWLLHEDGTIRSAIDSSMCLDLANSNTNNGNGILIWECHGGANQRWIVDGALLRSSVNETKVFDVFGGNTANGTRIQIWDSHGGANQQWERVPQP